jgi:hypothetical protein
MVEGRKGEDTTNRFLGAGKTYMLQMPAFTKPSFMGSDISIPAYTGF